MRIGILSVLIASLSLICCGLVGLSSTNIFPENDLWKYDNLEQVSPVTEQIFNDIITAGYESYINNEAVPRKENITINRLWDDSTVNANVRRTSKFNGEVIINMYGGLARRPEISPSAFALVLCHELGHTYGGAPFIYSQTDLSAEGQADYYATRHCYERIFERVQAVRDDLGWYEPFIEEKCDTSDFECKNSLEGGKALATLLSVLMGERVRPSFETPDKYIAPYTLTSYPKTSQCRLDTYLAGTMKGERPPCWFKK